MSEAQTIPAFDEEKFQKASDELALQLAAMLKEDGYEGEDAIDMAGEYLADQVTEIERKALNLLGVFKKLGYTADDFID